MASSALSWAKRVAIRLDVASPLAAVLTRVGARGWAERLDPSPRDIVMVELPRREGQPAGRIAMHLVLGHDQVARALRDGGWGGFEPPLPTVLAEIMRRWGGCLLDVGANTGLYSLIATAARPDTSAIAFEPVPEIVGLLRANLALNPRGGHVQIDEIAISDRSGSATLHLPPPQADGTIETSASLEADFKEQIATRFQVRTSTLDEAWHAHGRPPVTMVKVDVEGSEAKVLAGARDLIAECHPILSVEVLDRVDPAPLEALRREIGFVDVILTPSRAEIGSTPISAVSDAPNHLLVPPVRVDDLVEDLESSGLAVVRKV